MSHQPLVVWMLVACAAAWFALNTRGTHLADIGGTQPVFVAGPVPLCGAFSRLTCLVDGDTGWQGGKKWRLTAIDTPELSGAECGNEYQLAMAARDRLQALMGSGYRVVWSGRNDRFGRALVEIELADERDAGRVLLNEGLAQPWPNTGNVWCGR